MLCRTLIAAVAVTCMLSRTHALGPSTQHLDRIKDVVCVLLLSGMQKEDLDVSMLTKLQQHNVNINDMNNENLVQECMHFNNTKESNVIEIQPIIRESNKSLRKEIFDQEANKASDNYNESGNMLIKNGKRVLDDKNFTKIKTNDNKDIIHVNNDSPQLNSVIKFWQNLVTDKTIKIQEQTQKPIYRENDNVNLSSGKENKRSITEFVGTNTNDTINKFLETILLQRISGNSQQSSMPRSLNPNTANQGFHSVLWPQNKPNNVNVNYEFKRNSMNLPSLVNDDKMLQQDFNKVTENQYEYTKPQNSAHTLGMLSASDPSKQYYLLKPNGEINGNTKDNSNLNDYSYLSNYRRFTNVDITTKVPEHLFPANIINEIAESVKKLVLKDLQKEIRKTIITDTISSSTTTMTTISTQSTTKKELINITNNKDKINIQESILNKFLELFEEIKSFKQHAMTITGESKNEIDNKGIDQENVNKRVTNVQSLPSDTMNKAILLPLNSLPLSNNVDGIKQYSLVNSQKTFNFSPQLHKFRSNGTVFAKQNSKGILPITVQTNNIEIPPLGIPLDKPQNPINQNIVVTTLTPYRIGINNKDHSAQYFDKNRNFEAYHLKKYLPYVNKLSHEQSMHSQDSIPNEDIIRLTLDNNGDPKNNKNYYGTLNFGKYKANDAIYKERNVPKYHEKLENMGLLVDSPEENGYRIDCCNEKYAFSKTMIDCCNKKIASRQQMSLNSKKTISYDDDIHFKNFLKSQQKVTDMLERVLAEKGKIRSVETA